MNKKTFILITVFILKLAALNAQVKIAIGYIYDEMDSPCGQFTTAKGYRYEYSSNSSTNLADLRQKVTDELANYYSLSKNKVMVWTSNKPYGCVISFRKDISGFDCTTFNYAISFGNSESEAIENAKKEMRLYYSGDSFTVETVIH